MYKGFFWVTLVKMSMSPEECSLVFAYRIPFFLHALLQLVDVKLGKEEFAGHRR